MQPELDLVVVARASARESVLVEDDMLRGFRASISGVGVEEKGNWFLVVVGVDVVLCGLGVGESSEKQRGYRYPP